MVQVLWQAPRATEPAQQLQALRSTCQDSHQPSMMQAGWHKACKLVSLLFCQQQMLFFIRPSAATLSSHPFIAGKRRLAAVVGSTVVEPHVDTQASLQCCQRVLLVWEAVDEWKAWQYITLICQCYMLAGPHIPLYALSHHNA